MKAASSFITGLLAGAALGGVIALLYAPKSGKETREDIKQKIDELEKEFDSLKGKATAKTEQLRKDLTEKLAALQKEMKNYSKA